MYDFQARNSKELSVRQGEEVAVRRPFIVFVTGAPLFRNKKFENLDLSTELRN